MLKTIGKVLLESRRSADFVARLGGEEFALLIPGSSLPQCLVVLERYRHAIEMSRLRHGDQMLCITASFGAALSRPDEPFAELMARADEALYLAENSGRNRIGIHNGSETAFGADSRCTPNAEDESAECVAAS